MKSRERVAAVLNHQQPDRVPIDLASNCCTGINVISYNRLKKSLGITTPSYVRNIVMMISAPDLEENFMLLKEMGSDFVMVPRYVVDGFSARAWKPWTLKDGSECMVPGDFNPTENEAGDLEFSDHGTTFRMPKGGHYFDPVTYPLAGIERASDLDAVWPFVKNSSWLTMSDEELDFIETRSKKLHAETEFALVGDPYFFSVLQLPLQLFGYENLFVLMAADPEFFNYFMELYTNAVDEFITRYLQRVGRFLDAVVMTDDYGSQNGPQISPRMFSELVSPHLTRICGRIHEVSPNTKVVLHSCGSVYRLVPQFIESGVDALNPLQTSARDMNPEVLKREFGKDIVLWGGGVSAQTTLHHGSVEDISNEVKERMGTFKPGGGYVFCVDHDIQENVSSEKIRAVFMTAREHGRY